jgi:tetratricopeptide (TPR) repeat protein
MIQERSRPQLNRSARPQGPLQEMTAAVRIQPDYADAHNNLGTLLAGADDLAEAIYHFETALRSRPERPDDAPTRYNYAMVLGRTRRFDDAQRELEAPLRIDPQLAHLLGIRDSSRRLAERSVNRCPRAWRIY